MGSTWGKEVEESKILDYVEKLESIHELLSLQTELESFRELTPEAVPEYVKKLRSKDEKVRLTAAVVLGFMGENAESAISALTQALEDKDTQVRRFAANALGNIGEKAVDAVPELTKALKDENALVRTNAASALGSIGEEAKSAVPALIQALKDENTSVRTNAASALGNIGEETKSAVPALIQALKDESTSVRSSAASALGRIGEKAEQAVPALTKALKDENTRVRFSAVDALGRIGETTESTVLALTKALKDENTGVRQHAANTLGRIGEKAADAVKALTQALEDENTGVRQRAANALGKIGEKAADAVKALTQALEDENTQVRSSAAYALGMIGEKAAYAVPKLTQALEGKDTQVRMHTAYALGNIGEKAVDAVPKLTQALEDKDTRVRLGAAFALIKIGEKRVLAFNVLSQALQDKNKSIRPHAVNVLGSIATNYQDKARELSNKDLNRAITNLEKAQKIINNPKQDFKSSQKDALKRSLDFLKQKRDSRFQERILEWVAKNPLFTVLIIYLIFFPTLWLGIFYLRPLWLLRVDRALEPLSEYQLPDFLGNVNLPIKSLLLLEPFIYRHRVLDAWVAENIAAAKEGFEKKETVRDRNTHIPIPVILDRKTIGNFTGKDLQPIFNKTRATLLIHGEGGAGKTSLACQLAQWGMSDEPTQRLCKHQMLPVLIEEEIDSVETERSSSLQQTICGQLQALIGTAKPIPNKLLEHLLRERRILVIVDHLSEMNEATRNQIRPGDADFIANSLIITSRLEESLDSVPKTVVKPLRVTGNKLSSFMEAYLTQRGKRQLFNDAEYFDACRRLSLMVGERNITVLLAKLYAEQMIANVEKLHVNTLQNSYATSLQGLPNNIPDLMLAYLNELNRDTEENEPDNRTVQRDAKIIAWECLKQNFRSTHAKLDDVLIALDENNEVAIAHLEHLEKDLHLIQFVQPAQNKIRFALDPLAEYLAALYLMESYQDNDREWHKFIAKINLIRDKAAIKGFLLALRDCCLVKGKEARVPSFVTDELAKQTGLLSEQKQQPVKYT
ncbi:hypothetical protein BC008_35255 [Mastigocoleus testarum BC008]|uniref:NACHT domain-containing protein n=2 Tax=Mastigocoleus TaxID=996924 RepID=A0A0V7ZXT3_9CYAN|nr:hypothetical protein BC008_35255 [Mastigocoleus testarum BC008]